MSAIFVRACNLIEDLFKIKWITWLSASGSWSTSQSKERTTASLCPPDPVPGDRQERLNSVIGRFTCRIEAKRKKTDHLKI